jgi:hypothetical protein
MNSVASPNGTSGSTVGALRWLSRAIAASICSIMVSGCDQLGIETPQKTAEREQAEAKAVGGACRHALRAIEDCYTLNPKSDKSAVYTGWREMDEYMRENKLEGIAPVVPRPAPAASSPKAKASDSESEDDAPEEPAQHESKAGGKKAKGHSSH